jgi:hypothetical protein
MVSYLAQLAALAAIIPAIIAAPTTSSPPHLKIRNPMERDVVKNSYIVVYNDEVNKTMRASHIAGISSLLGKRAVGGIGAEWSLPTLKGFQVIADSPEVRSIFENS